MMSVEEIRVLLIDLVAVDEDMGDEQVADVQKACAIIEDVTADKARRLISSARDKACLQVFMSDGWSTDIRTRDVSFVGEVRVTRTGRLRTEFAMQRAIIIAKVGNEIQCVVKIARPRCLATKKCADLWAAATDFAPMLKLAGHSGVSISVYLQDGLFAKPFAKRMLARHDLFFVAEHCPLPFPSACDRELAELRDWVFTWHCCAHSCSLALKWGLASLVDGDGFFEGVHVAVSGLLRASTGLLLSVPEFIAGSVAFDLPEPLVPEDIEFLWSFLDVPPLLMEVFIRVNPKWDGQRLHVLSSLESAPDAIESITVCIKHCMKWCDFSETRWTKVGECGRMFLKALLVGVDRIAAIACKNSAISKWHLNGFVKKATSSVRLYLGVSALAGRPSESMLLELMSDDRFLLYSDKIWEVLQDEVNYVLRAPEYFWQTIADVLHVSATDYMGLVLESSCTSIGYLWMDVWQSLSEPPWKYCLGDISRNITDLKSAPPVTETTAAKIQVLAQLGYEEEVQAALELLKQSSLTTIMVEQAHGSGAQLMSRHPQVGPVVMTARMTVHNSRTLFAPSFFEKHEGRFVRRIAEFNKQIKNTDSHTTPRCAYLKLMIAHCKAHKTHGSPSDHAIRRAVFQNHGQCFSDLTHGQRAICEREAHATKRIKIDALVLDRQYVEGQLRLLRERNVETMAVGVANHMDCQRFSLEDFAAFGQKWDEYGPNDCSGRLLPPPAPIPHPVEQMLQERMSLYVTPSVQAPTWLSSVVNHRDKFQGCGL